MIPLSTQSSKPQLFEKYVIDKKYHIIKINANGHPIALDTNDGEKLLDSDFFAGSIAFSRDSKHVGWMHKLIYVLQRLHSIIFQRKPIDPNICHGMIILKQGTKSKNASTHPFLIAHSGEDGVRTANHDYLNEEDVTELILYRPIDKDVRELYKDYAEKTAYVEKKERQTALTPKTKASFSRWDAFVSLLHNKKHTLCEKRHPIDQKIIQRAAYLVADFLLQNQILNSRGRPKSLFCSAYATYTLQGTLLLHGLKRHSTKEIANFISTHAGPEVNRDQLAAKIKECFQKDIPEDPIAHSLWKAFRENKLTKYDSRYAMSAYVARLLDKLSTGTVVQ